eukprot:9298366-Pyramimonas_sp.AAC.2
MHRRPACAHTHFDRRGSGRASCVVLRCLASTTAHEAQTQDARPLPVRGVRRTGSTVPPRAPARACRGDGAGAEPKALAAVARSRRRGTRGPLDRSEGAGAQAMSRAGSRMFKACGVSVKGLVNNIGLEQELFLIPRECYFKRTDLQLTG